MANNEASFILKLIDMVTGPANKIALSMGMTSKSFENASTNADAFLNKSFKWNQFAQAAQGVTDVLSTITAPGMAFETALAGVSALTGKTGADLDKIALAARNNAIAFGGDASEALKSYQSLLGKLGPDIADDNDALVVMGNNVQMLAKTMGGDVAGATDALTTSMLQFGVDLKNPMQAAQSMSVIMDMITAGAKEGSAEIPAIAATMAKTGLSAKLAGISFSETNAIIQTMAMGAFEGAEAGTAFNSVLATMGKGNLLPHNQAKLLQNAGVDIQKLSDKTIPFKERLKELQKIQGKGSVVNAVFGEGGDRAVNILLENIDKIQEFQTKIEELGTTHKMVATIMGTSTEQTAQFMTKIKDLGISVFSMTKEWLPYMQFGTQAFELGSKLMPAFEFMKSGFDTLKGSLKSAAIASWGFIKASAMTAWQSLKTAGSMAIAGVSAIGSFVMPIVTATFAMLGLNTAMLANPAGAIVVGLLAIGGAIALVIVYWEDLMDFFRFVGNWFVEHNPFSWITDLIDNVFPGFKSYLKNLFNDILAFFMKVWEKILGVFNKVKSLFGGGALDMPNIGDGTIHYKTTDTQQIVGADNTPSNLAKKDKETTIAGNEGKARIVNLRIDKIEIMNKISGDLNQGLANFEEKIAQVLVAAARDAEIILTNG